MNIIITPQNKRITAKIKKLLTNHGFSFEIHESNNQPPHNPSHKKHRRIKKKSILTVADLAVDLPGYTVRRAKRIIKLRPMEFNILVYLISHLGQVVTRGMLLQKLWGSRSSLANSLEVHVSRLRKAIDYGSGKGLIETIPKVGYRLTPNR